jgi:hypothetical protein
MEKAMCTVTLDDVILDPSFVVVDPSLDVPPVLTVGGYSVKEITQDGYRAAASSLKIKYKGKSKKDIILAIAAKKVNMTIYKSLPSTRESFDTDVGAESDIDELQYEAFGISKPNASTRKTHNCPFLLLNVLFSDEFAERFGRLGDPATTDAMTQGQAGYEEPFWRDVQQACKNTTMGYAVLNFRHTEFDKAAIDPSQSHTIDHSWSKWRAIWKDLQSGYKKSDANFRQSGTHDSLFDNYILGRIDVLYLYFHLQIRPQLNEAVTESLRKGVFQDSGEKIIDYIATPSNKKRRSRSSPTSSVAGAIAQLSNQDSNIQEQKLKLMEEEVKQKQTIALEELGLHKQQFELATQKFILEKEICLGEIKKAEAESQKLCDEHQRFVTKEYISLTQQIIKLSKQCTDETSENYKTEIENLINILKRKRDEINI